MENRTSFPPLPLEEWKPTQETLHRFVQIVGKIRMTLAPFQNHWWHVPLYVTTRGIGTGSLPSQRGRFEIIFDSIDHQLKIYTGWQQHKFFDLYDGLSVAEFYYNLRQILNEIEADVKILAKPYELSPATPFEDDDEHHHYDRKYVERFSTILQQVEQVFKKFNSNFYGKVCPVQLYWHSFDLAVTRFSGKKAPPMHDANAVNREAYSHEVISFGFWPGDEKILRPAFYSYTYPAPKNLNQSTLQPDTAHWIDQNGSPLALLFYGDVRVAENPEKEILNFLESAYQAGVQKAGWELEELHQAL